MRLELEVRTFFQLQDRAFQKGRRTDENTNTILICCRRATYGRLRKKTQGHEFVDRFDREFAFSPRVTRGALDVVTELFFDNREIGAGQVDYTCVSAEEGSGEAHAGSGERPGLRGAAGFECSAQDPDPPHDGGSIRSGWTAENLQCSWGLHSPPQPTASLGAAFVEAGPHLSRNVRFHRALAVA